MSREPAYRQTGNPLIEGSLGRSIRFKTKAITQSRRDR